jgi:flavin reductase (DIM6/NTAB) family NADH-FMN oxidoreductase RutF
MTIRDADGYRGITLTGVLPLSIEPPTIAVALTREGGFADRLSEGQRIVLSLLQGEQIFLSERFAGRAPVPDADFSGVPFELDHHGVPMLLESAATVSGTVAARTSQGDHQLVVLAIDAGAIGADQDDPLVTYEASYRRLEVS